MKRKIAYLIFVISSYLLGTAFYFGIIYFPFHLFTNVSEYPLIYLSLIISFIICIINFKKILKAINWFTYNTFGLSFN